jgi:hypothetical protein
MAKKKKPLQITDGTNPAPLAGEYTPAEGELLPKPKLMLKLDLAKTNAYAQQLLNMEENAATNMIRGQIGLQMALIGERVINYLEDLSEADNWLARTAINDNLAILTKCAAQLSVARVNLEKALGRSLGTDLPPDTGHAPSEARELTFEEFSAQVAAERSKQ